MRALMRCHQHEIEAVVDLLNAVFDCDAGHVGLQGQWNGDEVRLLHEPSGGFKAALQHVPVE